MKTITLSLIAIGLMLCAGLSAQSVQYLDANNIKSGYVPGGSLFMQDSVTYNLYEVPKGSGIKSIFVSSFWLSGLDPGGNLHVAAQQYANIANWTYGPIATNYNTGYDTKYDKVFPISASDISYHRAHYTDPGYIPAADIAQWPGNGDTANGEAAILAPFVDVDSNGLYEPAHGDYPDVCGNKAIFLMMNDGRPGVNSCSSMHAELHVLAYAIAGTAPIGNTTFLKVTVYNRSGADYHDVYLSNFVDNDLGCANNDRVGCDTPGNYFYTYNGVVAGAIGDQGSVCPTGEIGYGLQKVTQGTVFLNHKLSSFACYTNGASTAQADPTTCQQYRNYQNGYWSDGTPRTYGGFGLGGTIPCPYMFPGDPTDTSQWSEINPQSGPSIQAGDRRSVGTVSLDVLHAGQHVTTDIAYVTSFADSTAPNLGELTQLRRDVQTLQTLYGQGVLCAASPTTGLNDVSNVPEQIRLYPNPTRSTITITSSDMLIYAQVTDVQGRELISRQVNSNHAVIDLSQLTKGIYLVKVKTTSAERTEKVIVE